MEPAAAAVNGDDWGSARVHRRVAIARMRQNQRPPGEHVRPVRRLGRRGSTCPAAWSPSSARAAGIEAARSMLRRGCASFRGRPRGVGPGVAHLREREWASPIPERLGPPSVSRGLPLCRERTMAEAASYGRTRPSADQMGVPHQPLLWQEGNGPSRDSPTVCARPAHPTTDRCPTSAQRWTRSVGSDTTTRGSRPTPVADT